MPSSPVHTEGSLQYGSKTLPYSTLPTMSDSAHSAADPRYRSGRYQTQLTGYRAFLPAPLPPDPPVRLEGEIQSLLSPADRALGRLDGSIQTLPNPDLFVFMYVRKEAVLSSQIEGTQSSLQDLLAAEAHILSPDAPKDVDEVVNYVVAMNYGLDRLRELPASIRLIREIHRLLLHGVRGARLTPGELRTSQNWIGAGGCTLNEATFVPPPPHEVPTAFSNPSTCVPSSPWLRFRNSPAPPSPRPTALSPASSNLASCRRRLAISATASSATPLTSLSSATTHHMLPMKRKKPRHDRRT